jgi:membrane-bound lytic murein transglycosylase F
MPIGARCLPALFMAALAACSPQGETFQAVPPPQQSGELVVLTHSGPTTFFEDPEGRYAGFEYELVKAFADELGLRLKLVVLAQPAEVVPALARQRGHLAAAGLVNSPELAHVVKFGPPYQDTGLEVVYDTDRGRPRSLADLAGRRVVIAAGSPHVPLLRQQQERLPALAWTEVHVRDTEELVGRITDGLADFAIAESHAVDIARNFHPTIGSAFTIGAPRSLAWAFPKNADPALLKQVENFFARVRRDGTLARLLDKYYGHLQRLDQADIVTFVTRLRTVLPKYRPYFIEAQDLTGIDWRLLAALGYQESHWNPLAVSPTGVRGLMMLVPQTAQLMGVTDVLDARQSILGGARYLARLKEILWRVPEPDRTWIAIAAYNIGFGHLEDARSLARRRELDPNQWADLRRVLPLLARPEYASTLRFGFARGGEPVILTENIRQYYDIIVRHEPPHQPAFRSLVDVPLPALKPLPAAGSR